MMSEPSVTTMKSEEARNSWRDLLDVAQEGGAVVIERYDKPQAVVVNYKQWTEWQTWKRKRKQRWDRIRQEMRDGQSVPLEVVEAELRERGLL